MDESTQQKLSLKALIGLVAGSMIGSGIFALPASFALNTGALGAILAWCVAGAGMLTLALVFQTLSLRKPNLNSGIYAYAQEALGNYAGFCSALGYWMGCCLADVACLVLIKATFGNFFDAFGDGTTTTALVCASLLLWAVHFLILRGVKEAAMLNTIATAAKVIPIFIFIIIVIANFRQEIFAINFWGTEDHSLAGVFRQVKSTMLVTVFVFVGIEGASVYSRFAKNRKDIGTATVLGFLGVLCLLVLVTIPSYGVMLRGDLAALPKPSMAGILEALVGRWGGIFISVSLIIAILGNYLSWSLLAAEVLFAAARDKAMPNVFARENAIRVPAAALLASNILIQFFLLLTPFADYAFKLALKMTSSMTLIPYLLVALCAFKLAMRGDAYEHSEKRARRRDACIGMIAGIYAVIMILAGGAELLLLSALLYFSGSFFYIVARREQNKYVFSKTEKIVFVLLGIAAASAVYYLAAGSVPVSDSPYPY